MAIGQMLTETGAGRGSGGTEPRVLGWSSPLCDSWLCDLPHYARSLGLRVHNYKMGRLGLVTLKVLLALRIHEAGYA